MVVGETNLQSTLACILQEIDRILLLSILSHDQDTVHAEKGCVEMHDFYMTALMLLTGHGMKAGILAHAEIAHFPTWCITRTWNALGLRPCASQALMMHLVGKCTICRRAWVLAIFSGMMVGVTSSCMGMKYCKIISRNLLLSTCLEWKFHLFQSMGIWKAISYQFVVRTAWEVSQMLIAVEV